MSAAVRIPDITRVQTSYLSALGEGDRRGATDIALDLLDQGVPAPTIISDVIAGGQVKVGQAWQEGRWSIAEEHRASSVADSVLQSVSDAAMQAPGAPAEGSLGSALVLCTEGEWHVLPGRLATETLRLRGFDAMLVGPSVPASDLPLFLGGDVPGAVAVSCSMPLSLVGAWRTISALRALGTHIVIGGRGFGPEGRWGLALGADSWAPDFESGADLMATALSAPGRAPREPVGAPAVTAEIFESSRDRESVVERAVTEALDRWPALADNLHHFRATREDLSSTLRVLQSAVLVGDDTILSDYVQWFEAVLAARSLPVSFVSSAFDLLVPALPDSVPLMRSAGQRALGMCWQPPTN